MMLAPRRSAAQHSSHDLALRPAANPCPLVLGPLGLLTLAADFTFHICLYKFFSFHEALRNGKREI